MVKKILALILAALMLFSVVACGKNDEEDETTGNYVNTSALDDGLPEKDMEGFELKILHDNGDYIGRWTNVQLDADDLMGNTINDEIYERNRTIEQRFNCKLTVDGSSCVLANTVTNWAASGDAPYDAIFIITWGAAKMNDVIIDLNEVPYISLDKEWWHPEARTISSAAGKQFAATSSFSLSGASAAHGFLFSKTMYENIEPGRSMYDYIDENNWTFETLYTISKKAYREGDTPDKNIYGVGNTAVKQLYNTLINGAGFSFVDLDDDGYLTFTIGNDLPSYMDRLQDFARIADGEAYYNDNPIDMETNRSEGNVLNGTALFEVSSIHSLAKQDLRESNYEFGFMPTPKYNADQDNYHSYVHTYETMTIMNTVPFDRYENIGIVLEALAFSSHHGVLNTFLEETITFRYAPDADCMEVMNLIQDTTHVAFSCVRVMRTLGTLGEVVGLAAGVCTREKCLPRDIYEKHLEKLKELMVRGVVINPMHAYPPGDYEHLAFKECNRFVTHPYVALPLENKEWMWKINHSGIPFKDHERFKGIEERELSKEEKEISDRFYQSLNK